MRLPANGAKLGSKSLIHDNNGNTILFRDFLQAFNNVVKPPDVGEEVILPSTLIRIPADALWITNNYSGDAPLVGPLDSLAYCRVDVVPRLKFGLLVHSCELSALFNPAFVKPRLILGYPLPPVEGNALQRPTVH
ncbi:MAG: hypothetical protein XD43_0067 [Thermococcales archaeon 44_46]|nr:MAG: hypothetical protein XD43_0067 [Thermococcales archaeon 44_46]